MAGVTVFEQTLHTRHVALSVVDGLLRALHLAGQFPPPLGSVSCYIAAQTSPVARTFDPPLELWSFRNQSGYLVLDGTYTRDAQAPRLPLGSGTYSIQVRGDYYREREFVLVWPPAVNQFRVPLNPQGNPDNVDLRPGPAYPLPDVTTSRFQLGPTILRGSLYAPAGDPIRDVLVEAVNLLPFLNPQELPALTDWPFLQARSDERGEWVIVLPGRRYLFNVPEIPAPNAPPVTRPITVRIHYANGPTDVTTNVELASEHSLRNTALRGHVLGPGGRPIEGAQVVTSVGPATSVSRANGAWFLYFDLNQPDVPNVTVTATAPNGATASDSSVQAKHGATVVVPTFRFS